MKLGQFIVALWPIGKVKPYPKNARTLSDSAVEKVAKSIELYGWRQPIVVDAKGVIIAGHTRHKAALKLKLKEVPVHVAKDLAPAAVKAYRLMDNRSHQESSWDDALLAEELRALTDLDFDLAFTGFDPSEIKGLMARESDADPDDAPPVLEDAISRHGDLWLLGQHRVLAGDCTESASVERLCTPKAPVLLITDPPYGVELDMEWRDRAGHNAMAPATKSYMKIAMGGKGISGDTKADWADAFALVPTLEVAYVWHATSHLVEVAVGLERIGFQVRQQIIWQKTVAAMGRQAYHWKHEPCWYAVKKGKTGRWVGGHDQTTVWEAASPKHIMSGSKEEKFPHPTQKPIELMQRPISNHGEVGDCVYEPFLGSGTTLMAAELTGRICYGIAATLEATGATFEATARARQKAA